MSSTGHPWADSNVTSFALFRMLRHAPGAMPPIIALEPGGAEFPQVASALNMAREALGTQSALDALTRLAIKWDIEQGNRHFYGDHGQARTAAQYFINRVRASLPRTVVDENITNPDILGTHPRLRWSGLNFKSRDQTVIINAYRCDDMIRASNSHEGSQYRRFQFLLACTFLHEIGGHMFVTFMAHNRDGHTTPPTMIHSLYQSQQGIGSGEAGRYLELVWFGGALESYRDPAKGNHQSGDPHLLLESNRALRIPQRFIDHFVAYRLTFPFPTTGQPIHPSTRHSMGPTYPPLQKLPRPNAHPMLAANSPAVRGFRIRLDQLRRVARDPRQRLTVV